MWIILASGFVVVGANLSWGRAMLWAGGTHAYLADELHAWADLLDSLGPVLVGLGVLVFATLLGYGAFRVLTRMADRIKYWEPTSEERVVLENGDVVRPAISDSRNVPARTRDTSKIDAWARLGEFNAARRGPVVVASNDEDHSRKS